MHWMFALLPLFNLILLFGMYHSQSVDWRRSLLSASIVWGVEVVAITEILSRFNAISFAGIALAWTIATLTIGRVFWQKYCSTLTKAIQFCRHKSLANTLQNLTIWKQVCILGMGVIVLLIFVVAIVSPPNNPDSMRYHMARVANWMQNHNVDHYFSAVAAQLDQPPWNSFTILQFQELSGGDRFANLVQWGCWIGSAIGASLIARYLGANPPGQLIAAVLCLTIPASILQASSTQNDLVTAYWLVCFVSCVLAIHPVNREASSSVLSLRTSLELGSSFGLALLSKGTAYIFGLPLAIWAGWILFEQVQWKIWRAMLPGSLILIGINGGHWWRNWGVFGSPLGVAGDITRNQSLSLAGLYSNTLRSLGTHLATVIPGGNQAIEAIIARLHSMAGIDLNDPQTTLSSQPFQLVPHPPPIINFHDSVSGNPIHLILIFLSVAIYILRPQLWTKHLTRFLFALISAFLLFCLLIKWQIWINRLHTPIFVLFSAFVAVVFIRSFTSLALRYFLVGILLFSAIPYTLFNASRPLSITPQISEHFRLLTPASIFAVPRQDLYFANRWHVKDIFYETADQIEASHCRQIGLEMTWEYPLWMILRSRQQPNQPPYVFKHISTRFSSRPSTPVQSDQPSRSFQPCAVVRWFRNLDPRTPLPREYYRLHEVLRVETDPEQYFQLFLKQEDAVGFQEKSKL